MTDLRIGNGYDVHKFAPDRKLILGGVKIDYHLGLEGHSDADVLTHAIMDALLGAAGLPDIGRQFPPADEKFKNADSMVLLRQVTEMITEKGYSVINIDSVIIAEEPKMNPYVEKMKENLAGVLQVGSDRINVKATTTEKLGFTGRKEGIAAMAVCLIEKNG